MKKYFSSLLVLLLVLAIALPAQAATQQLVIDEVSIASDVQPQVKNSRVMVPMRVISENLGATVHWANETVTLSKKGVNIKLKANSKSVVVNGKTVQLDTAPYIKNNRLFVPMRFLAEAFGANVHYEDGTVFVISKPFYIDAVKVTGLLHEYHMTMGGAEELIKSPSYNENVYEIFEGNKGKVIPEPADYSWQIHSVSEGGYYKGGQYDFLDESGSLIKRFDFYSLVNADTPKFIIHDVTKDTWYEFKYEAFSTIWATFQHAKENGFLKEISNTIP